MAANGGEASWASLQIQGRDVILLGEAPDAGALHDVRRRILATPGVANLFANTRIRVWGTLTEPTVKPLATKIRRPTLIGTWPSNAAEGLSLELAGELYVLGETEELQTNGANWAFTPSAALPDGRYDVEVTAWTAERSASDQGSHELTIDTVPPPAPHVDRYLGRSLMPELSGQWHPEQAAGLRVEVAGRSYELGKDRELTSTPAGRWTLNVVSPLADGDNEVVATAIDHVGNQQPDRTSNEAFVDRNPPKVPTVERFESSRAFILSGTWAKDDAVDLEVHVAGRVYQLRKGNALKSDEKGRWTLSPTVLPPEGTYDVLVRTRDRAGNVSEDETTDELVIRFLPERDISHAFEEAPRPMTAIMCQAAFKKILAQSPVKFIGRTAKLDPLSLPVLDALAGKAAQCPDARVEISAHTDSVGDFSENRKLTQLRAYAVAAHFARRGITRARLSSVGYGEVRPIASNNTAAGRAKNQRLELYVKR